MTVPKYEDCVKKAAAQIDTAHKAGHLVYPSELVHLLKLGKFDDQALVIDTMMLNTPEISAVTDSTIESRSASSKDFRAFAANHDRAETRRKAYLDFIKQAIENRSGNYTEILNTFDRQICQGFTTHPAFVNDKVSWSPSDPVGALISYKINAGMSASEALAALLSSSVTVIDCAIAQVIIKYLAHLDALMTIYGAELGRQYFDQAFGDAEGTTPEIRRLCLVPGYSLNESIAPYLSNKSTMRLCAIEGQYSQQRVTEFHIGDHLTWCNDSDYSHVHPWGHMGGLHLVCMGKDRYMGLGFLGNENQISQFGYEAYLEPRTSWDAMRDNKPLQVELKPKCLHVHRISSTAYRVDPKKWSLLDKPPEFIQCLDSNIEQMTKSRFGKFAINAKLSRHWKRTPFAEEVSTIVRLYSDLLTKPERERLGLDSTARRHLSDTERTKIQSHSPHVVIELKPIKGQMRYVFTGPIDEMAFVRQGGWKDKPLAQTEPASVGMRSKIAASVCHQYERAAELQTSMSATELASSMQKAPVPKPE